MSPHSPRPPNDLVRFCIARKMSSVAGLRQRPCVRSMEVLIAELPSAARRMPIGSIEHRSRHPREDHLGDATGAINLGLQLEARGIWQKLRPGIDKPPMSDIVGPCCDSACSCNKGRLGRRLTTGIGELPLPETRRQTLPRTRGGG